MSDFVLDPGVTFLNHGSFGACPRAVLDEQARIRARMEAQPVRFFIRELEGSIDEARATLARFLGADPGTLVFVANATTGVNAVLRSLELAPGDELLTTDHAYNACRNALDLVAARARAKVVVAPVPVPVRSPEEVLAAVAGAVTARTRLALVDHVTSPTALVFPVEAIVRALEGRGVPVLVDGAHAPGMLPLRLDHLGASYYVGNCHKWIGAPKGAGFLCARRDRQEGLRPVVISHGANRLHRTRSRFHLEFDWVGTDDPSPWLAVPAALRYYAGQVGGWSGVMERNRALALDARALLARRLGGEPTGTEGMTGSMAAIRLPAGPLDPAAGYRETDPLQDALGERFGIEAPIFRWPRHPARIVRVSAHVYNRLEDFARLADALEHLLREERERP